MEQIGIYFVDATDLEGWTDETLVEALEKPLAAIGIEVEIGKHTNEIVFFDNVGYEDTLREQIQAIVEKVVTE
jgi:hypothetical protein